MRVAFLVHCSLGLTLKYKIEKQHKYFCYLCKSNAFNASERYYLYTKYALFVVETEPKKKKTG